MTQQQELYVSALQVSLLRSYWETVYQWHEIQIPFDKKVYSSSLWLKNDKEVFCIFVQQQYFRYEEMK